MKFVKTMTVCLALSSAGAMAADFSEADALFAQRDGNEANVVKARDLYRAAVSSGSLTQEETVYAMQQIGRTYFFQGEVLVGKDTDADQDKRRTLFGECWKDVMPGFAPDKLGVATPQYFYWSATCLALYSEVSGTLENLANVGKLKKFVEEGKTLDTRYEGGGVLRVNAGVISNPKAKPIPGLYDPEQALVDIEAAIAKDPFPTQDMSGQDFCENYRRKVMVLKELGRNPEAKQFGEETIKNFNDLLSQGYPASLLPETKHCVSVVGTLISDI